jgi:hypothetical protein
VVTAAIRLLFTTRDGSPSKNRWSRGAGYLLLSSRLPAVLLPALIPPRSRYRQPKRKLQPRL